MPQAYIVEAVRTAGGRRGGRLAGVHPVDLAAKSLDAIMERSGLEATAIDDVVMGCVSQGGEQAMQVGRNAVLAASAIALKLEALQQDDISINPAKIEGGSANNVVPDHAILRFNIRPKSTDAMNRFDGQLDAILDAGIDRDSTVIALGGVIMLTVLLSVFAHGVSAAPTAIRYGRWMDRVQPSAEGRSSDEPMPSRGHHRH